jgi:hypothetical protein
MRLLIPLIIFNPAGVDHQPGCRILQDATTAILAETLNPWQMVFDFSIAAPGFDLCQVFGLLAVTVWPQAGA